nr:PREDICTED: V-type proton ATPase subunit S1-like protein [Latimeria chalumnae]|eukprot:XP_005997833.1 PREDICTED: V-type proton ATPase subunit S1-like protein [Latimeria chalumnae]
MEDKLANISNEGKIFKIRSQSFSISSDTILFNVIYSSNSVTYKENLKVKGQISGQMSDHKKEETISSTATYIEQVALQMLSYKSSAQRMTGSELLQARKQSQYTPINVTENGRPCILFWAKRITIKFKNYTQLDLTDKTFGAHSKVDVKDSVCSDENAILSLKFGDIDIVKGLVIRFIMVNTHYKQSGQNWFSLNSVQIQYNGSLQAMFNATDIYAPAAYSYHCQYVSSLQKHNALLVPISKDDIARLWQITFTDFQIQGFNVEAAGKFAYTSDCTSFFTPAILMGLVMSLVLLLVLAYALHMLIHLKSIDRHYECKASTVHFPKSKEIDAEDEKEPLRNNTECYELKDQPMYIAYMQQCVSVSK